MHPFPRPCVSRDMTTIAAPPQGSDVRRTVAVDFLYLELSMPAAAARTPTSSVRWPRSTTSCRRSGRRSKCAASTCSPSSRRELQARDVADEIRVDGRDISPEPLESECGADGCGCGSGVSCRLWPYGGADHPAAPVGLIVDAILSALYAGPAAGDADVVRGAGQPDPRARGRPGRVLRVTAVADPVVAWGESRAAREVHRPPGCRSAGRGGRAAGGAVAHPPAPG